MQIQTKELEDFKLEMTKSLEENRKYTNKGMQIQTNTMNKQLEDFKLEMTKKLEGT